MIKVCILGPFNIAAVADLFRADDQPVLRGLAEAGGDSLVALAKARLAAGLFTEVITTSRRLSGGNRRFDAPGLRCTICPRRRRHAMRDFYAMERARLREAIEGSVADVLHANWTYEFALAAIESGRPALITVHDHARKMLRLLGPPYLVNYLCTQRVFRRGTAFSAVSPFVAEYVRARAPARDVLVIPNCVEPELLEGPRPLPADGLVVASAISWAGFKNARTALRAFALVAARMPAAKYVLMGPGLESSGPAAEWAGRHGLADGVDFLGNVPHGRVISEFERSLVVLHPSRMESFGSPLAEGMALGKVVIGGNRAGGVPWVLDGGTDGVLADIDSPEALAEPILRAMNDPAWALEMGERARASVARRFAPGVVLEEYGSAYESAAWRWK